MRTPSRREGLVRLSRRSRTAGACAPVPRGARWLEDSGGKSGRQRDERGAQYLSRPETASQWTAGPRARWGRLQDCWHGPCIGEDEAETAHLTGVSVMLVTAFPSKVFWPAMDWAVAILAGRGAGLPPGPGCRHRRRHAALGRLSLLTSGVTLAPKRVRAVGVLPPQSPPPGSAGRPCRRLPYPVQSAFPASPAGHRAPAGRAARAAPRLAPR